MSEAKFTKGQWEAKVHDEGESLCAALVYLSNKGGFDLSGCPDCAANAHLIASAPEMYEMLKVITETLGDEYTEEMDKIDSLLAKARGEYGN